jgi:eukaryotic-like serine/threonine-protein kinase
MDAVPDALLASRYDLGPLVGLGGTAQVYRAWDHEDGCPVAVKIFRPGSALAPGYGGARELVALTGVRHRGLVGVRGAGVDPQGCPFVVMDLVDGQSLSARLHDGPLDIAAVTRLGAALADALAVVHARGVVHRDVKPANVLLDTDGHPWLTDFGIARVVDATRVTATGVVVGTAAYMAPEQVRGEAVGSAADIYALGLVLLEAATGHREYDGGALESAVARLHRAPVVPASLPDPLGPTLRRMTAPVPDDRPPASEVAAALRRPPAGSPPRRARTVAAIAARRAAPVAALACLVAGALTGALSLAGSEHPAEEPRVAVAPAAAPPVPLALPPDVAVLADEPAPAPVPVALAGPDRAAPWTAPRASAGRSDSGHDAADRNEDDATAAATRDAHRDGGDTTSAGRTKDAAVDKGDHNRGKGDDKSDKGKSGKNDGGHGRKDGHSGSGSGSGEG